MKQQERQERSRMEILKAAVEEFGRQDYSQVSIESICRNHKISKGMMYHYFSGKDALFLLCVKEMFGALELYVKEHMTEPTGEDTLQDIRDFFLLREYFFRKNPKYQCIFVNAMLRIPEHLKPEIRALREPMRQLNRVFLNQVMCRCQLRPNMDQEQAIHYLESVEYVFWDMVRYDRTGTELMDVSTMLKTVTECLDMILFGVLRQDGGQSH